MHWRGGIINHGKVLILGGLNPSYCYLIHLTGRRAPPPRRSPATQRYAPEHWPEHCVQYCIAPEHRSTMYRCTVYYHSTRALCTVFWVTSHHHSTVYRDAGYHQSTRVLCTGVLCTGYCHNNRVLCIIILFTIRIGVSSTYVTYVYSYYHQRQCT